jgi:hypothetical protein
MDIQPIWLRYGIYYGLVSIVFSLLSYYVMPFGFGMQILIGLVIMTAFLILSGKAQRNENRDIMSYGEALKTTFLTGFSGSAISVLFSIILINLIDPGLTEKLAEMSVDAARSMMETFKMPEDQMAEALEKAEEQSLDAFTPLKQLLNLFQVAILVLIVSAIVSIFLKKEEDITKINIKDIGNQDLSQ